MSLKNPYCLQLIIEFHPETHITFSDFSGYATQGIFYKMVSTIDNPFAAEIHKSKNPAPYAVTPIIDTNTGKIVYRELAPHRPYFFILTAIGDRLCKTIGEAALQLDKIVLNGIECNVRQIGVKIIDLEQIMKNAMAIKKMAVHFLSPTKFVAPPRDVSELIGGDGRVMLAPPRNVYFPDPERLLVGILNFWEANVGRIEARDMYRKWLKAGGVACSGYPQGLRTVSLRTGGASIGFYGKVHYVIPSDSLSSKPFAKLTDLLLKIGEIFNVGDERTAGLGMIKYWGYEYVPE